MRNKSRLLVAATALLSLLAAAWLPAAAKKSIPVAPADRGACDVHDERTITSPDGVWVAKWETEGCAYFLLETTFTGRVTIRKAASSPDFAIVVFDQSGPAVIVDLNWSHADELHMQLDLSDAAVISTSLREIPGVHFSYGVTIDPRLRPNFSADLVSKLEASPDEDSRAYGQQIDRFDAWMRDYAK